MTFEEAIERIEEKCGIEDENPFLPKERDLDPSLALYIIKNLKETYAPKIKMPQKIMLVFMEMKFNYQVDGRLRSHRLPPKKLQRRRNNDGLATSRID